jgi:hypothetical protein
MIGHIYYAIGLLVAFSILSFILRFRKIYSTKEWIEKYEKVTGKKPIRKDYRSKEEYSASETFIVLSSVELAWIIGGFITNSWYVFGSLLVVSFLLNLIIKPIKFTFFHKYISLSFLIFKFSVYLYLIINHFHLHLDTWFIINQYIW